MWDKDNCRRFGPCLSIIVIVVCVCVCLPVGIIFLWTTPERVAIVNANLTRFELATTPTTSLFFNLSFTMRIDNSIWYGHADYQDMEIACYYNTKKFDSVKLRNLGLDIMKTGIVNHSTSGNITVNMTSNEVDAFKRSNETGYFDIEIWLRGTIFPLEYDFGNDTTHYYYYRGQIYDDRDFALDLSYQCKLRLPLITSQNSTTPDNFNPVKCN
ncbi:hypothetical protein LUZ62_066787 [Rhynchospora pubera]|uniref:Late embryogenesis abundant protein LEA-2 subgroup domain-containing protein n=1 Tax=Rhynchospora pubera TaxID=906938 RepID=A0AAV8EQQ6_9POAL|nr:hypothetical protein LUZ62_066787 [Rhynchospora pubera]